MTIVVVLPIVVVVKTILLYDCCTEIYTDGHAVLMFALFFLDVFSLIALAFVAVTISRSVYNCDVVSRSAMSHGT